MENTENTDLKPGDIVYVKSYPPIKMVIAYVGKDNVGCTYLSDGKFITEKFYYSVLAKQEDIIE